ncbi:DUF4097 domain-containing protein [Lachnospiraceae bacterium OttesenSCG-928-D06]|nr:DUF4097 domain-containing protein [Lachnospiraceae bacterium OttesenSCG-928-D06]
MNKFMKWCATIAIVLVSIGLILVLVVSVTQGSDYMYRFITSNEETQRIWQRMEDIGLEEKISTLEDKLESEFEEAIEKPIKPEAVVDFQGATIFKNDQEILTGDVSLMQLANIDEIQKLKLEIGGCIFRVEESEDNNFYLEGENVGKLQVYTKGDSLYLNVLRSATVLNEIKKSQIVLYIPEYSYYEEVEISFGAGIMESCAMYTDELELSLGGGSISIDYLEAEEVSISIGAGEVILEEMEVSEIKASVGAGNMELTGNISKVAKLECAAGNISLNLEGDLEDYDYNIECVLGNVNLDGTTYQSLASARKIENGANKEIEINCSIGNISVTF